MTQNKRLFSISIFHIPFILSCAYCHFMEKYGSSNILFYFLTFLLSETEDGNYYFNIRIYCKNCVHILIKLPVNLYYVQVFPFVLVSKYIYWLLYYNLPLWVRIPPETSETVILGSYPATVRNVDCFTEVPARAWNNARRGTRGPPPPVVLEYRHITFRVLVQRKTQTKKIKFCLVLLYFVKWLTFRLFVGI